MASETKNQALEQKESILDLILESSDDCIKITDLDGRIEFMNAGGLRKLGLRDQKDIAGSPWLDFWKDESLASARQAFAKAVRGEPANFTGARKEGKNSRYWNVAVSPVRDRAGRVVRVLVTSRELTDQVRSLTDESQLVEDRFQLFVESVKDYALFMLDPAGYVTTWNEGARRIKGYEASEIIGQHFSRFYTREDLDRDHPAEELQIARRTGRFEEEGWRVRKDGSRFWANVVLSRVNDRAGKLVGFAKVTRDLTQQKLAEAGKIEEQKLRDRELLLEELFASSPSFMTLISVPDFRYLKSNVRHQQLVRKRDIIGKRLADVHPELEAQGVLDLLRRVAATGEPFVGREMPVHYSATETEPGKTVYLDFVYQPLRSPHGEIYAINAQGYDVTAKVRSRRAVEIERENFRKLFKQTPEMVCILGGPEHTFEFVNEAHVRVLGFDSTGMTVREAQPESVEVHGILDDVYRTGETAFLHHIPVTVGGRVRYFDLTYSARRNESGVIDGIMVLGTEITEHVESAKRLEHAVAERTKDLRESEGFLDSVIENIPHMVFVKDAKNLRFVRFNRAGEGLLGVPRGELIGKSDFDFFPREQAEHFVAKDREVLAAGKVVDIAEEPINTRNNGERILHTRKIPILGLEGKPEYLLGISEDITEWKHAEAERVRVIREQAALEERTREMERTAFLAEASTVLAASLDYHQTLRDLAGLLVPAMADWCTVTMVQEDGTNERLAAVHRDPAKAHLIDELAKYYPRSASEAAGIGHVIRTKTPIFSPAVEDGALAAHARDERHLEIMRELATTSAIVVPIMARGQAIGAISLVSDRRTRAYTENDLATALELGRRAGIAIENATLYESAQKAIRTRDEFLSIASHELKTPLTSLKIQAQMRARDLRKGNLQRFAPENLPKLIMDDERQLNRLIRLVEDMLDVSRITTGRITYSAEEFDLCDLVRDVASRYSSQFEAAGVALTIDAERPVRGNWDRYRLEQVIVNLLTNALKYGEAKPVEVRVTRRDGHAVLTVRDHGPGISKGDQTRIFEQFERAVSGSNISGLGLGLFISRKIVEAHQGSIRVESEASRGSTFVVELPVDPVWDKPPSPDGGSPEARPLL